MFEVDICLYSFYVASAYVSAYVSILYRNAYACQSTCMRKRVWICLSEVIRISHVSLECQLSCSDYYLSRWWKHLSISHVVMLILWAVSYSVALNIRVTYLLLNTKIYTFYNFARHKLCERLPKMAYGYYNMPIMHLHIIRTEV